MKRMVVDVLARPFHGPEDGVARYPHLILLPFCLQGHFLTTGFGPGRAIHRPSPTLACRTGTTGHVKKHLLHTVRGCKHEPAFSLWFTINHVYRVLI